MAGKPTASRSQEQNSTKRVAPSSSTDSQSKRQKSNDSQPIPPPRRNRTKTSKQVAIDASEQTKEIARLKRQLAVADKENTQQRQQLHKVQEQQRRFEQEYEDLYDRTAPESQDEDDMGGGQLFENEHSDSDADVGMRPMKTGLFDSSVQTVNIITQSPPATTRKSNTRVPVTKFMGNVQPLPTPPTTQRSRGHVTGASNNVQRLPTPAPAPPAQTQATALPPEESEESEMQEPEVRPGQDGKALSHYSMRTKKMLRASVRLFEANVLSKNMYPDEAESLEWAQEIWASAQEGYLDEDEKRIRLTDDMMRLMHQRATRVRNATRTRIQPLVEPLFGFKSSSNSAAVRFNMELYLTLATDFGFYYEEPRARTGLMRHPIIFQAICAGFFYHKQSYGVKDPSAFRPISIPALAVVLTLIEISLSQWSTGTFQRRDLDENVDRSLFIKHAARINEWAKLDEIKTTALRVKWAKQALVRSGAVPQVEIPDITMSKEDRAQALAELNEMDENEEIGDDGYDNNYDLGNGEDNGKTGEDGSFENENNGSYENGENGKDDDFVNGEDSGFVNGEDSGFVNGEDSDFVNEEDGGFKSGKNKEDDGFKIGENGEDSDFEYGEDDGFEDGENGGFSNGDNAEGGTEDVYKRNGEGVDTRAHGRDTQRTIKSRGASQNREPATPKTPNSTTLSALHDIEKTMPRLRRHEISQVRVQDWQKKSAQTGRGSGGVNIAKEGRAVSTRKAT